MPSLTTTETARARHNTYTLLSRLYLDGLSPDLLPYVRELPALSDRLPRSPAMVEVAARHYRLFGLNVFPYESVFLDPAGLLGGTFSNRVARFYRATGYRPGPDVAPDHVGHQLGLLALLAAAEADAHDKGQQQIARQQQQRQQSFLTEHLARWLAPFLIAVHRQADPFYRSVAHLTWEVVGDHLQKGAASWSLPSPPALLADENTGLRQITATLLAPPLCGFFLARDELGKLGRRNRLPRGFGDRQQMLLNLFRSAAQYEQFSSLLANLRSVVSTWRRAYVEHARTSPAMAGSVTVWQQRLETTDALLARLTEEADAFIQEQ